MFINTQFRVSIKRRFLVATTIMLVIFVITTAFVKIHTRTCKLMFGMCIYLSTYLPPGVRGFFPFTLISVLCLNGNNFVYYNNYVGNMYGIILCVYHVCLYVCMGV